MLDKPVKSLVQEEALRSLYSNNFCEGCDARLEWHRLFINGVWSDVYGCIDCMDFNRGYEPILMIPVRDSDENSIKYWGKYDG